MSLPTLLTAPTDRYSQGAYEFDHRMAHRTLSLNMPPMSRFSVAPYFFSPQTNTGGWLQNHQQAHNDFRVSLPVMWGWWEIETQEYGVFSTQNLQDVNMNDPRQLAWWTWVNSMDHMIAEDLLVSQ